MKSKIYVPLFILLLCVALTISAMIVFVMDPYFQYHAPLFGFQPILDNERYQNPGAAKNLEYDSIIVGSSLAENFDAQWFNDAFGIDTLKLTTEGASIEDYRINISRAEEANAHELKYIFFNFENNLIKHVYNEPGYDLPEYLYDDCVINDVGYLLNKNILWTCATTGIINLRHNAPPVTRAYQWYEGPSEFSKEIVLENAELPEVFVPIEQKPATIDENAINGIKVLTDLVDENSNTQFYLFYSPVSMLYWYSVYEEGNALSEISILKYSMEQFLKYDNIHLFFPSTYEMITNLDNYKDSIHYSMDVQRLIFEQMRDGKNEVTKENYQQRINEFQDMILNCDFEKVFRE